LRNVDVNPRGLGEQDYAVAAKASIPHPYSLAVAHDKLPSPCRSHNQLLNSAVAPSKQP
jgi:hypothetical protein